MQKDFNQFIEDVVTEEAREAVQREIEKQISGTQWEAHKTVTPDQATIVTRLVTMDDSCEHPQVEQLMRDSGIDPEQWVCIKSEPKYWQGYIKNKSKEIETVDLYALRLVCEPKAPRFKILLPDIVDMNPAWFTERQPLDPPTAWATKPHHYLVTSDPQIPWIDRNLHELTCRLAQAIQADGWFELGDYLDLPMLSRYRPKLARDPNETSFHASLNESIQLGAQIALERTQSLPVYAKKVVIPGNHDERMDTYQIDHARDLYGVRAAEIGPYESYPALDLFRLMHMYEMGWDCLRGEFGGYPYTECEIAPGVLGIHGTVANGKSGRSVEVELEERACHVIQAHCNKLSMISRTKAGPDGKPVTYFGIEDGMLGQVEGGMRFAKRPVNNWTQGLAVVTVYPDNNVEFNLVPYVNGAIRYQGMEFRADLNKSWSIV